MDTKAVEKIVKALEKTSKQLTKSNLTKGKISVKGGMQNAIDAVETVREQATSLNTYWKLEAVEDVVKGPVIYLTKRS